MRTCTSILRTLWMLQTHLLNSWNDCTVSCSPRCSKQKCYCISRPWLHGEGHWEHSLPADWYSFMKSWTSSHPINSFSYCTLPYTDCLLPLILATPTWFLCSGWLCMCITRAWQQPQRLPHFFAQKLCRKKFATFLNRGLVVWSVSTINTHKIMSFHDVAIGTYCRSWVQLHV